MVIMQLERRKEEIIDRHMNAMIRINEELLKRIDAGLKERTTDGGVDVSAFDKIKGMFRITTDKGLRMSSDHRLELAKLYFDLTKTNVEAIMTDEREGFKSSLSDINEQIAEAKAELRQIEYELKQTESEDDEEMRKDQEMRYKQLTGRDWISRL